MQENNCCIEKVINFVKDLEKIYKQEKDNLISMLEEIQEKFGYIPKEAQKELSKYTNGRNLWCNYILF